MAGNDCESMNTMRKWIPEGKLAAVCFTVDDIHPGKSTDAYEAGGDLEKGALGHLLWLLERHPKLRVTLFTTADWREISAFPTRKLLAKIPFVRDRVFLAEILPVGTMSLIRHPEFVHFLNHMPRTDIALHGLYHVHQGPRIPIEFQLQSVDECVEILRRAIDIFKEAGLKFVPGMNPPGWDLPANLARAMIQLGLTFVCSARDIFTPVSPGAKTDMSGLRGVSLLHPQLICDGKLVHITANFQATSSVDRALEIVEHGGLLSIKAHIIKAASGHIALDGMDKLYRNYLDSLFTRLEDRYGDQLWWTSPSRVAERVLGTTPKTDGVTK